MGHDCLMRTVGGVSLLGDEMFRNQVETVSVPHRKRTRCHGAVHSKALVSPYESYLS